MGDRSNIAVIQSADNSEQVWFYGHWAGEQNAQTVQDVLKRNERWSDDSYLARMLFCAFCGKDQFDAATGFGISTRIQDNEHSIVVVDIPKQRVFLIEENQLDKKRFNVPAGFEPRQAWAFAEFRDLEELPPV